MKRNLINMSFYDIHGRYILMALNIIYMAVAVLWLCVGIWVAFAVHELVGAIFMAIAILKFLLNFYGYQGAHKRNAKKLKIYGWILLVLTVLAVIAAIVNTINISTRDEENPEVAKMMRQFNIMSYINVMIEVVCIVLAFCLSSAVSEKSNLPPTYSKA